MKAIILAAGMSRRMKRQKLLLPFGSGTMLSAVMISVLEAGFDETILVTSPETYSRFSELHPDFAAKCAGCGTPLTVAVNEHPEQGQASSLKIGLDASGSGPFCVTLGDLPLVKSSMFDEYRREFLSLPRTHTALIPRRGSATGHPAFFSAAWRERLLSASGDVGGRHVIGLYDGEIAWTEGRGEFFRDIDTTEDYDSIVQND